MEEQYNSINTLLTESKINAKKMTNNTKKIDENLSLSNNESDVIFKNNVSFKQIVNIVKSYINYSFLINLG